LEKVLFLDIETVPEVNAYDELDEKKRELWDAKSQYLQKREEKTADEIFDKAGIFAEFGKVVCVSVGFIKVENEAPQLRLTSYYGHDEAKLLGDFGQLLKRYYNTERELLCAHNGKEFDFPYLARRMLINGLPLPNALDIAGKKPWEVNHLDTMQLWKFGDFKHYTSLSLLTHVFGIPTPKDDISGADVGKVYWEEEDVERIARYCEKDVKATAQLFLRYKGRPLIAEENIVTVTG